MLINAAIVFALPGLIASVLALIATDRGMRATPYYAAAAIAFGLSGVLLALDGGTIPTVLAAGAAAAHACAWWHDGGGDGTRRRLKAWSSRFHGIRRTAPSSA